MLHPLPDAVGVNLFVGVVGINTVAEKNIDHLILRISPGTGSCISEVTKGTRGSTDTAITLFAIGHRQLHIKSQTAATSRLSAGKKLHRLGIKVLLAAVLTAIHDHLHQRRQVGTIAENSCRTADSAQKGNRRIMHIPTQNLLAPMAILLRRHNLLLLKPIQRMVPDSPQTHRMVKRTVDITVKP
ncbi:MAG: hypothetical protein IPN95_15390 [Bacteroidetes bacterium]|nr:hypothetical protein [Bacteroidota bacterium]